MPSHNVWCGGCKTNWTVLATGHNCEITKEYNKLNDNNYHHLRYVEPTENGAVILKILLPIDKTSDVRAFEEVDYLVSEYCYNDKRRQLILERLSTSRF